MTKNFLTTIAAAGALAATPVVAQATIQPASSPAQSESEMGGTAGPTLIIVALAAAGMALLLLTDDDDDEVPISA